MKVRTQSLFTLMIVGMMFGAGCAKKAVVEDESALPTAANADENEFGDSDNGKAMGLETVRFPYDSFLLDSEAKAVITSNAQTMKDKASMKVQIEGHCDSRGGIQYNLALGEKRANAVKKFLMEQGIAADRISIISFGKERPIASGETEEAHARNRRANFVVTSR